MVTAKKMFTAKIMDILVFEKKIFSRLHNKYYLQTMADLGESAQILSLRYIQLHGKATTLEVGGG